VQDKLTRQQQANLIVRQKALNDQKAEISARNSKLIGRVSAKADARGRRRRRSQGRQEGFADGQNSRFSKGQTAAYAQGKPLA
jgi:hypothetical protein